MANNLVIIRGDDYDLPLYFSETVNGVTSALDITGYTVFFTAKKKSDNGPTDDNAVISKTITSHTDPTNGLTEIPLSSADTAAEIDTYKYDIQIKDASGKISTVDRADLEITDDVTKRTS